MGTLPLSGRSQPAGGTDGGAGPSATLLTSARFSAGHLSRRGAPDSGLGPQGRGLLLSRPVGGADLERVNIQHHRVCNHRPTLQARKLRLKRGKGTCPGSHKRAEFEHKPTGSVLSNWSFQGSLPPSSTLPPGTSKGLNPPPLGALGPRTAYSHASSELPCDSPEKGEVCLRSHREPGAGLESG